MYLKVLTRYIRIHRLSFVVHSAKKGEVEDIATLGSITSRCPIATPAEGKDKSSGVLVLTR